MKLSWISNNNGNISILLLGKFAQSRKEGNNFMSARPSVSTLYQRSSYWMDFREIWYWGFVWKFVQELRNYLKSDTNTGHSTLRPQYVLLLLAT